MQQHPVDQIGREPQRLDEVDEQHHTQLAGVVPDLVVIGVVEQQRLALVPVADFVADADFQLVLGAGDDQAEMQPQHAVVGSAMRRDVLAGLKDREHRGDHAGDLLQRLPGLRALLDVLLHLQAVAAQEERLPVAVICDGGDVGGDFVEGRQFVLALEHALQLPADVRRAGLDLLGPREGGVVVDRRIAMDRVFQIEPFGPFDNCHEESGDGARARHWLQAVGSKLLRNVSVLAGHLKAPHEEIDWELAS